MKETHNFFTSILKDYTDLNEYFTSISHFTDSPDLLSNFEPKTNDTLDDINLHTQDILDVILAIHLKLVKHMALVK